MNQYTSGSDVFSGLGEKLDSAGRKMSTPLRANISRGNPEKVFDLIEKVGGGTYGDVFKVWHQDIYLLQNGWFAESSQ